MEGTQQLRNNWDYATTPSPESVLLTGLQPIGDAVSAYNQRSFEAGQANIAATRAAQLEQLKMQLATAHDKTVMAWHANQAKTIMDWHAAQDAGRLQQLKAINDYKSKNNAVTLAQKNGFPVLPQQQAESDEAYVTRQNASNETSHAAWEKSTLPFLKQNMSDVAQGRDIVTGIRQSVYKAAADEVVTGIPTWVSAQDQKDPGVLAYNQAIAQGKSPKDALMASALKSPALLAAFKQYSTGQLDVLANNIMSSKGYAENLKYANSLVQDAGGKLAMFAKQHPNEYPDLFTQAHQSIVDDYTALAKRASDAADAARTSGTVDPQTQQQLDTQKTNAQGAADAAVASHKRLSQSLASRALPYVAVAEHPLLAGAALASSQFPNATSAMSDLSNPVTAASNLILPNIMGTTGAAPPSAQDVIAARAAMINSNPQLSANAFVDNKLAQLGLPPVSSLIAARSAATKQASVASGATPTNSLSSLYPMTIGSLPSQSDYGSPVSAPSPQQDVSGLAMPPSSADEVTAQLLQQNNWIAQPQLANP